MKQQCRAERGGTVAASSRSVPTLFLAAFLSACSGINPAVDRDPDAGLHSNTGTDSGTDTDGGIQAPDPDPNLTNEQRAALRALHYDPTPPPPDPSNRVADDPRARTFGQRLFFESSLS